uniref:Uncharacterized protein n=1 Tax=viral metagenome TaxID=1070528 RepID=A0A6M3L5K2_9ZZZZ
MSEVYYEEAISLASFYFAQIFFLYLPKANILRAEEFCGNIDIGKFMDCPNPCYTARAEPSAPSGEMHFQCMPLPAPTNEKIIGKIKNFIFLGG